MSYQVLARKWRPRTFHELAGQEHVVRALTNALDRQRLHHAFLFTGTRGVGKTTIARIFAKSLNCEVGVSSHPCGQCSACLEIDAGRFVDLIEVDAASRTKVEDTRELLENVQYAPSRGRFKVYLIDEVHMLSTHSFNALLKTLEEPPPHVKFLLATTDPRKLPVTVLSRCLQFNLKRLPAALIAQYLHRVLEAEGIPREEEAVRLIARAGDGSMRDALSLLDQAIAFGGDRVETAAVGAMLGGVDRRRVVGLLEALAADDAAAVLRQVAELDALSPDYAAVLAELLSLLQRVALAQVVPAAVPDDDLADPGDARRLAGMLAPEDVQLFHQIALLGRRDLPLMPEPRGGFEMVLLRMLCFRPATLETAVSPPSRTATAPAPAMAPTTPVSRPPVALAAPPAPVPPVSEWGLLVEQLGLTGMARQVALHCALTMGDGDFFQLALEPGHAQMLTKTVEDRIKAALEQHLGRSIHLKFQVGNVTAMTPADQQKQQQAERQQTAVERIAQDRHVRDLREMFDARIAAIHPLDDDVDG
ncbi:MAG: DNA polymerase III subunit gamma/tau [Candidatus Contendobacter sp.]|nr:DNA polymerase III subunit gamma/tau [Candidatus Contendobacter sp.]MDG4558778.1 DNA polymerase III subunit gamma/tau [Candidatus Contendobacter sp.]